MGSFSMTCAISGLPIGYGDDVRYLLLTQNPYHNGKNAGQMHVYPTDAWFPRTFPLRAKYNDYGSVEDLRTGPQADAWTEGFRKDLVEKGWGDNSCHDVPTSKGMPMDAMLNAIREGRVHVRRSGGRIQDVTRKVRETLKKSNPDHPMARHAVPKGVPTRRRVERALTRLGYKMSEEYRGGLLVNRVDRHTVRVRAGEFKDRPGQLAKIRDALADRWAGMVRCGSGNYADEAELILCPLPSSGIRIYKRDRDPSLCVSHAMIREDVWRSLCSSTLHPEWQDAETCEGYIKAAKTTWAQCIGKNESWERSSVRNERFWLHDDAIPFTVGLGTHWWHMVDAWKARALSKAERDDFLATAGEFAFVMRWLIETRYLWRPSSPCGPQFGNWQAHAAWSKIVGGIAGGIVEKQRKERGE